MNRLAFAIVVLLILCTVPVYGQSALRDVHEFGDWEYVTNGTGLTITAYRGNGKNIEIPENINRIGRNTFVGCTDLETIVVASKNKTYDSRNNSNAIILRITVKEE